MKIDKTYLQAFKTLSVVFDECGLFKIPVEEIAEIDCKATDKLFGESDSFRMWDGTVKITPKGGAVLDKSYTDENDTLKNRIAQYCDISDIWLEKHDGRKIRFSLPYDPLIESIEQTEVELSNCPSAQIDEDGYITIGIGESSKMPKRTDNNYDELVEGWDELFKGYRSDALKANLSILTNYYEDETPCLFAEVELLNKRVKRLSPLTFIFTGIQKVNYKIYADELHSCVELNMARLINGNIFVDFDGYGLTFECKRIEVTNEIFSF